MNDCGNGLYGLTAVCPNQLVTAEMITHTVRSNQLEAIYNVTSQYTFYAQLSLYRSLGIIAITTFLIWVYTRRAYVFLSNIEAIDSGRSTRYLLDLKFKSENSSTISRWYWIRKYREEVIDSSEIHKLYYSIRSMQKLLSMGFAAPEKKKVSSTTNEFIFVHSTISNFSKITSVLGGKVLLLVNSISEIVHRITIENGGIVNRTDGQNFLLVWDLGDAHQSILRACISIQKTCRSAPQLEKFKSHPSLLGQIRLQFGIHSGWAIEGVVGSWSSKIDYRYLSADVNLAEIFSNLATIYGVDMVVSHVFAERLEDGLREIDRVVIEGTQIGFFTTTVPENQALFNMGYENYIA